MEFKALIKGIQTVAAEEGEMVLFTSLAQISSDYIGI